MTSRNIAFYTPEIALTLLLIFYVLVLFDTSKASVIYNQQQTNANDASLHPYKTSPPPITSGLYKAVSLLKQGYAQENESESLEHQNQNSDIAINPSKTYPIYQATYTNKKGAVFLSEFPIAVGVSFQCNEATIYPHLPTLAFLFTSSLSEAANAKVFGCKDIGVTNDGNREYEAMAGDPNSIPANSLIPNSKFLFSLKGSPIVAVNLSDVASSFSANDFDALMNSLTAYSPSTDNLGSSK